MLQKYKIAILAPNSLDSPSETFIKAHYDNLDGDVSFIYGSPVPNRVWNKETIKAKMSHKNRILSRLGLNQLKWSIREEALYQFLRKENFDVVLAEYGTLASHVVNVCRELKLPLIVSFHGFDASHTSTITSYREKYKDLFNYSSYIIGVSKKMIENLKDLGVPKSKLIYNPYGVKKDFFLTQPKYSSNNFLAVGRFVHKKAPHLTLAAFRKVFEVYPNARLIMAGNGVVTPDLSEICFDLVKLWGLDGAVSFRGSTSHDEILELMRSSFCFLQHSVTPLSGDMEGTPVAIIEASASALPVISTIHAGIPEVILHEKTGYLVKEKEVDKMANYMLMLFEDRKLAKTLGESGREAMRMEYTMEKHISVINQLIRDVIRRSQN